MFRYFVYFTFRNKYEGSTRSGNAVIELGEPIRTHEKIIKMQHTIEIDLDVHDVMIVNLSQLSGDADDKEKRES